MNRSVRSGTVLAILAAAAVVTSFIAYVMLLDQQGQQPESIMTALQGAPTWLLVVFAASTAAIVIAIPRAPGRLRRGLLMGTAIVLTLVGVLAIFSIGVALLVAAVLAGLAAGADGTPRRTVALGGHRRPR